MTARPRVMLTLKLEQKHERTLDAIKNKLGLSGEDIDEQFGVVSLDPDKDLYAVLVNEDIASKVTAEDIVAGGPFSNPRIESFGPTEENRSDET